MAGLGLLTRRRAIQAFPVENPVGALMEEALCWYDARVQGATNESLAANPILIDLTGNGYDLTLNNFAFTEASGIAADGSLAFDGSNDYARNSKLPILTDYTILARRSRTKNDNYACLASKGERSGNYTVGAFTFESYRKTRSFGTELSIYAASSGVTWQTATSYRGTTINKGSAVDKAIFNIGYTYDYGDRYWTGNLYSLVLFPRTLTQEEIDLVVNNIL